MAVYIRLKNVQQTDGVKRQSMPPCEVVVLVMFNNMYSTCCSFYVPIDFYTKNTRMKIKKKLKDPALVLNYKCIYKNCVEFV